MRAVRKHGDPRRRTERNEVQRRMMKGDFEVEVYATEFRRIKRKIEFEAQHGPVRHLVSEGKPVIE